MIDWHCNDLVVLNLRPNTIAQRRRVLGRLMRFHSIDESLLLALEPADLAAFLGRPLAPNSRAVETTHLRRFFEWCVEVELLDLSPARRLRRPKTPRLLPHPIGEGDLAMAVELAEPTRIRPWLLLGAFAGLRACEMAPLRAEAILWDQEPPLIRIEEGKGGSGGTVELSPDLAAYLRACDLPTAGWLFPLRDGREGHVAAHNVSQAVNNYLHGIGLPDTLHSTRHRFGTELLRSSGGNPARRAGRAPSPVSPHHPDVHVRGPRRGRRSDRPAPEPRRPRSGEATWARAGGSGDRAARPPQALGDGAG